MVRISGSGSHRGVGCGSIRASVFALSAFRFICPASVLLDICPKKPPSAGLTPVVISFLSFNVLRESIPLFKCAPPSTALQNIIIKASVNGMVCGFIMISFSEYIYVNFVNIIKNAAVEVKGTVISSIKLIQICSKVRYKEYYKR
jgi:hypothetical protein